MVSKESLTYGVNERIMSFILKDEPIPANQWRGTAVKSCVYTLVVDLFFYQLTPFVDYKQLLPTK